jgi:hypothetical protein
MKPITSLLGALALAILLGAPALPGQIVDVGNGVINNTNTSYPAPYGNYYWGSRHQFVYQAAELTAAGLPPGAAITDLGFDVTNLNGLQPHLNWTVGIAHTTAADASAWIPGVSPSHFTASLTPVLGWNLHAICQFVWDGVSNIVVETCHQNSSYVANASVNQTATAFVSSRWFRQDAVGTCGNTGVTGTMAQRPNTRFVFQAMAAPTDYQVNQPQMSLLIDGVAGNPCQKAVTNHDFYVCSTSLTATGSILASTTLPGSLWDIAISGSPLVPATAGGLTLVDGQVININLGAPVAFMNGFLGATFPGAGIPGITSSSISFGYSLMPTTDASLQAVIIDPAALTGLRLSQGAELHVRVVPNVASFNPTLADNATVTLVFSAPPYCWAPSIAFYGTAYTQMHILSNGRVMFGAAGTTTAAPTQALFVSNNPSVGVWTDWNPALAGGATVASLAGPGIVRVDFTTRYAGELAGPLCTFGIEFNTNTGDVTLDGLTGIAANPQGGGGGLFSATADSMIMGISRGLSTATNGGATNFSMAAGGVAPNATQMWFDWYGAVNPGPGRCPTLVPGTRNGIVFSPDPGVAPNYSWLGL